MNSVTVVGSGIVGLTSAITLQEAGYTVRIVAKEGFEKTLSNKVGAIWFPFGVSQRSKSNTWAVQAYERYESEAKLGNGVTFIPFITAYTEQSNTEWTTQLPSGMVRKATAEELPPGMEMAFISIVPLAEPPIYLPELFHRFIANGGTFEIKEIPSLYEMSQLDHYVINCTGLGAKDLCDDEDLHPMRGQILRCRKMTTPSFANDTQRGKLSYIINRSEDSIIGGTDYEYDWNENVNPTDTKLILERLEATDNQERPEILETIVGLRPYRSAVRFEFDAEYTNIFHNYGHGGAGFTIAWGCAKELAEVLTS